MHLPSPIWVFFGFPLGFPLGFLGFPVGFPAFLLFFRFPWPLLFSPEMLIFQGSGVAGSHLRARPGIPTKSGRHHPIPTGRTRLGFRLGLLRMSVATAGISNSDNRKSLRRFLVPRNTAKGSTTLPGGQDPRRRIPARG